MNQRDLVYLLAEIMRMHKVSEEIEVNTNLGDSRGPCINLRGYTVWVEED